MEDRTPLKEAGADMGRIIELARKNILDGLWMSTIIVLMDTIGEKRATNLIADASDGMNDSFEELCALLRIDSEVEKKRIAGELLFGV
jgi:hypothetical protein